MDSPDVPSSTTKRENQIQGPRPTPLRVSKDSHKIKKPPVAPNPRHPHAPPLPLPVAGNQPVIIYSVSPKPIFVEPSDFRSIVQHLTGRSSTPTAEPLDAPPVSPAARLAAIERTSPRERRRGEYEGVPVEVDVDFDVGQVPGILTPAPANLQDISAGMFSPPAEGQNQLGLGFGVSELMSPFLSNTSFLPSPSALFFPNAPIVSPSPSSGDFFNIFDF